MEKEKAKMKEEIFNLKDDVINSLVAERDEQIESKFRYMDQLEECHRRIKELEGEQYKANNKGELTNENDAPKCENEVNLLTEKAIEMNAPTENTNESKIATAVSDISPTASSCDSGIGMNVELFKNHIESFKLDMETKLEKLIDERLAQKHLERRYSNAVEEPMPSSNISGAITEKYPLDFEEDRERNIIIHGIIEDEWTDKEKIEEIFKITNTKHNPMSMFRLGTKCPEKVRPIMLRMKKISDKEEFMSKLWMLKCVKKKYNRLSITNDYTLDERKIIKDYVEEAKKRNMTTMKGNVWKVRGTPRQGMRLIKISMQE